MAGDMAWKPVAQVADISPDTQTLRVTLDSEAVCLYRLSGDRVCATQDKCPHGNANLSDGYVEDDTVECPLHQTVFDLATGKPQCPPATTDLKCYDVRVEAGTIYLRVEGA